MAKTRCSGQIDDCMGNALLILPHHCWLPSHIGEGDREQYKMSSKILLGFQIFKGPSQLLLLLNTLNYGIC
jgi:hypothetical protein